MELIDILWQYQKRFPKKQTAYIKLSLKSSTNAIKFFLSVQNASSEVNIKCMNILSLLININNYDQ